MGELLLICNVTAVGCFFLRATNITNGVKKGASGHLRLSLVRTQYLVKFNSFILQSSYYIIIMVIITVY